MTTTDSLLASHQLRPRILGAAAALLIVLTACSGSATGSDATSPPTTAPAATTVSDDLATATAPAPDALLDGAIETYATGYEFSTTTSVNDQHVTTQTGRWLDSASEVFVDSGGAQVEFIITPEGQWTRLPDGDWEQLDTEPGTGYPLQGMADAQAVEVLTHEGSRTSVAATYAATDMGLSGSPIEVVLDFEGALLVGFAFTAEVDGATIETSTTLSLPTNTTPITPPTT